MVYKTVLTSKWYVSQAKEEEHEVLKVLIRQSYISNIEFCFDIILYFI